MVPKQLDSEENGSHLRLTFTLLSKKMMGKIFCHPQTGRRRGYGPAGPRRPASAQGSPRHCTGQVSRQADTAVIRLPREKPSHTVLRVGAKCRSRHRGRVAPFALLSLLPLNLQSRFNWGRRRKKSVWACPPKSLCAGHQKGRGGTMIDPG